MIYFFSFLFVIFGLNFALLASDIVSSQNGNWFDSSTWETGKIPAEGDRVIIKDSVFLNTNLIIGDSPKAGSKAAIRISNSGKLTVGNNVKLVCRGDFRASGNVTLEAGAILEIDASKSASPLTTVYNIEITPGNSAAHFQIKGTASSRCKVYANPEGAHTRITDGDQDGGGRIQATYCNFKNLGGHPDYRAYQYKLSSNGDKFSFINCTFENCSQIKHNGRFSVPQGGYIEFIRCKWINSVVKPESVLDQWEEWDIFETWSQYHTTAKLINCDFDKRVALHFPKDYEIEDCVFREGINNFTGEWWGGSWKSFKRNFIRWKNDEGSIAIQYGNSIEDCIFIEDDPDGWNPHFGRISSGTGAVYIIGCIFWWNGVAANAEGDGFFIKGASSGNRSDNIVTFERNIFLPNATGPDGINNLSCTGFTILHESDNKQVNFKRNTVYVGDGRGGINLGETNPATSGDVGEIKYNIFVGGINNDGMKINDLGHSERDVFLAENVDYNVGCRITDGALYGNGSGKGYDLFTFSGSNVVGANDLDDIDPKFVDPTRTPTSWSGSLNATMDRLSPGGGNTMNDLLEYLREGFKPRNISLHRAGEPKDKYPDFGAVALD